MEEISDSKVAKAPLEDLKVAKAPLEDLKFLQIKIPAIPENLEVVENLPWNRRRSKWIKTKHPLHLTFIEFKVHPDIIEQVKVWFVGKSREILKLFTFLCFNQRQIFYKKKFHILSLIPSTNGPLEKITLERENLLERLFEDFGAVKNPNPVEKDGLPIWTYHSSTGKILFTTSLYHRPEVWYPHISLAFKFSSLDQREESSYFKEVDSIFASVGDQLLLEVLEKD